MNLYFDLDQGRLVTSAGSNEALATLSLKRGDILPITLRFLRGITVQELASGATGVLGIKPAGQIGGEFLCTASWSKSGTGTSTTYGFILALDTGELADAMAEETSYIADFELEFRYDGLVVSSQTVRAEITADTITGDEGSPTQLPTPDDYVAARAVRYDLAQSLTGPQKNQAHANLDLGTSASADTGTTEGTIPVLGSGGKLAASLLPAFRAADINDSTAAGRALLTAENPAAQLSDNILTEATTARTLGLSDVGKFIDFTHASGCAITIPVTGSGGGQVAWPVGSEIIGYRSGGLLTLSIAGVTVLGNAIAGVDANQPFVLKHKSASTWFFL